MDLNIQFFPFMISSILLALEEFVKKYVQGARASRVQIGRALEEVPPTLALQFLMRDKSTFI